MTDTLIVLGCLVVGYVVGRIQGEVRHARACEQMGIHLHKLLTFKEPDLRRFLSRLADSLVGEKK